MRPRPLPPPAARTTLLEHLLAAGAGMKRTRAKELLRAGLLRVNGEPATRHDHPLAPGDRVEVADAAIPARRDLPFPVLHEDEHMIAIDKPSGLLTIGTPGEKTRTAYALLNRALAASRERAFIVHRLDRETSGVLLLAKSEKAKDALMSRWQEARKLYLAVVEGTPRPAEQRLVHFLREDERLRVRAHDNPVHNSKRASLAFRVARAGRVHALLEVELETGRKNQIRAQLEAIGHPIAGDAKHGARTNPCGRLCLHAARLSVPHPATGERLVLESPAPGEFEALARG